MRVVFMGTPAFAVPSLRALVAAHQVVAVYTQPDRPAGRGREPRPSAVKITAQEFGLAVTQPPTLRDAAVLEGLRASAPDVVCVVAYGALLPTGALDVPPLGCFNVHASILPRHRGAAPIERAILDGDLETGVAVMRMEEGLDTGPVALQMRVPVADCTAIELRTRLAELGAEALVAVLARIEVDDVAWVAQDAAAATYAPKIRSIDLALDPRLPARTLLRRVRASGESAVSRAVIEGRLVTVQQAGEVECSPGAGRAALTPDGLVLGCCEGALAVMQLTPSGKRSMSGVEFARGARLAAGSVWSAPL
jgi:methionyl-tRNA formyltransferase